MKQIKPEKAKEPDKKKEEKEKKTFGLSVDKEAIMNQIKIHKGAPGEIDDEEDSTDQRGFDRLVD